MKDIYLKNQVNQNCKIYPNNFFGYTKVTIDQPLIENGQVKKDKKGNIKTDTNKREYERVPLSENIDDYYGREVKPYLTDSWIDTSKNKIGYEINFTKYFYNFKQQRSLDEISREIKSLDIEISKLSKSLFDE